MLNKVLQSDCSYLKLISKLSFMARPIKETPVLTGKNAIKFILEMKKSEGKKTDPKTRARMKENFAKFQSIAQF